MGKPAHLGAGLLKLAGWLCLFLVEEFAKPLVEPLHAASAVHYLLLASVKRMAGPTDFDLQLRHGAACDKLVAASASYLGFFVVFGMNVLFHND